MDRTNEPAAPAAQDPTASRPNQRWPLAALAGAILVAIILASVAALWSPDDDAGGHGRVFVIPYGSYQRVVPELESAIEIPTDIRFAAGQDAAITIKNDDVVTHRAGPFLVGAGQTYTQRFPDPGTYPIACAVDPAESIVVTVEG